jgi:hypothetical protein
MIPARARKLGNSSKPIKLVTVLRRSALLLHLFCFSALWFSVAALAAAPQGQPAPPVLSAAEAQALVQRALATELRTARDTSHPMRFRLRKSSPRLTTVKEIVETRDGAVARLVSQFDRPLSLPDEQKEQARLDLLLSDPSRQQHRKQSEDEDFGIVLNLLRMLPKAFIYQYAGMGQSPCGPVQKFTFSPNPRFNPPDMQTQALTAMSGELWIDAAQERVTRLEGHLQQDTDYAWGILGKLNKGGWLVMEQADMGGHQWRIARFQINMNLRILFKVKSFDTVEEMSRYEPVPPGIDYRQAIQMLRSPQGGHAGSR